jgi:murein DD-endopeptidase MepM/ murein hydrolase activator NlpD
MSARRALDGPHLHYEIIVNGRFVDPMKIRVPAARSSTDGAPHRRDQGASANQ